MRVPMFIALVAVAVGLSIWWVRDDADPARMAQRSATTGPERGTTTTSLRPPDVVDVSPDDDARQPAAERTVSHSRSDAVAIDDHTNVSPSTTEAADGIGARVEVHFAVEAPDDTVLDPGSVDLVVAFVDEAGEQARVDCNSTTTLAPGVYRAACVAPNEHFGPVVTFTVTDAPLEVTLAAPRALDVSFAYVSSTDGSPVVGLDVSLSRADLVGIVESSSLRQATTDAAGVVRIESMATGNWIVESTGAGHADDVFDLDLPGEWRDSIGSDASVDLGTVRIQPLRPLVMQLTGHRDWDNPVEFHVAQLPGGDRVPFDASGRAELELGRYEEPLLLKMWYPGGQLGLLYLDAGIPAADDVLTIDVSHDRVLEVEVELSDEASAVLERDESPLQICYRNGRGDSAICGRNIPGSGVYRIPGIHADRATVSYAATLGGTLTSLASESVSLGPSGTTAVKLVVEGPPRHLRLADAEGAPLSDFHVELRELPDHTTWLTGSITDDEGRYRAPYTSAESLSIRASDADGRHVIVDQPVDADPADDAAVADWARESYVRVTARDVPVQGVRVELAGPHSPTPYLVDITGEDGCTPKRLFSHASNALVRIQTEDYWLLDNTMPIGDGPVEVVLYPYGQLRVEASVPLASITHTEFSDEQRGSLEDWIGAGSIDVASTQEGLQLIRVPIGTYEVTRATGARERFEVPDAGVVTIADAP